MLALNAYGEIMINFNSNISSISNTGCEEISNFSLRILQMDVPIADLVKGMMPWSNHTGSSFESIDIFRHNGTVRASHAFNIDRSNLATFSMLACAPSIVRISHWMSSRDHFVVCLLDICGDYLDVRIINKFETYPFLLVSSWIWICTCVCTQTGAVFGLLYSTPQYQLVYWR